MKRFVVELSDDTWNRLRAYTKAENADCDTKLTPQEMAEVIIRINVDALMFSYCIFYSFYPTSWSSSRFGLFFLKDITVRYGKMKSQR